MNRERKTGENEVTVAGVNNVDLTQCLDAT